MPFLDHSNHRGKMIVRAPFRIIGLVQRGALTQLESYEGYLKKKRLKLVLYNFIKCIIMMYTHISFIIKYDLIKISPACGPSTSNNVWRDFRLSVSAIATVARKSFNGKFSAKIEFRPDILCYHYRRWHRKSKIPPYIVW